MPKDYIEMSKRSVVNQHLHQLKIPSPKEEKVQSISFAWPQFIWLCSFTRISINWKKNVEWLKLKVNYSHTATIIIIIFPFRFVSSIQQLILDSSIEGKCAVYQSVK